MATNDDNIDKTPVESAPSPKEIASGSANSTPPPSTDDGSAADKVFKTGPWSRFMARLRPLLKSFSGMFGLILVFTVCVLLTLPWRFMLQVPTFAENTIWNGDDIVAPWELRGEDESVMIYGRKYIEETNEKVCLVSEEKLVNSLITLDNLDKLMQSIDTQTSPSDIVRLVRDKCDISLLPQTCNILTDPEGRSIVLSTVRKMANDMFARGMTEDGFILRGQGTKGHVRLQNENDQLTTMSVAGILEFPTEAFNYMANVWLRVNYPKAQYFDACADLGRQILTPNVTFDPAATEEHKMQMLANLRSDFPIPKGTPILRSHEMISTEKLLLLHSIFQTRWDAFLLDSLGRSIIILMLFLQVMLTLMRQKPADLSFTCSSIMMIALPIFTALLLPVALSMFNIVPGKLEMYCFPVGMIGMFFSLLYGARIGVTFVLFSTLLYGTINNCDPAFYPFALLPGIAVCLMIPNGLTERYKLLFPGFVISVISLLFLLSMLLRGGTPPFPVMPMFFICLLNGIVCYGLTLMLLPIIEFVFRITTPWRLWEITSLHHPLLVKMAEVAPGTLEHVKNVATLAENVAAAFGANELLVRAGAYFHDIGKMKHPEYFSENQNTPKERRLHDSLSPMISAAIIKQHIKSGELMARQAKLPLAVVKFIPEHHGDTKISYFYDKAVKMYGDYIHDKDLSYSGPKPQSIETAIVMIADSLEAASTAKYKSAKNVSEEDIRAFVNAIIDGKVKERQFDNCDMTIKQLNMMRTTFTKSLLAHLHSRVDYPSEESDDKPKPASQSAGVPHSPAAAAPVEQKED